MAERVIKQGLSVIFIKVSGGAEESLIHTLLKSSIPLIATLSACLKSPCD